MSACLPRPLGLLLTTLLVGCFAPAEAPEDDSALDDDTVDCDIVIDATEPFDGQVDAYWRAPLVFTFSEPDPTAQVDAPFPGTETWDETGTVLTFTPDAPLEPAQDYTVGVDFCHGSPQIDFRTSAYGAPIDNPGALIGQTFAVDLAAGRFLDGAGIAEPLSSFFNRSVLFEVVGMGPGGLDLRVGVSTASGALAQDPCFGTVDLEGLDASDAPFFAFDVEDFVFGAWEGSLALLAFQLEGTVSPDGETVGGIAYSVIVPVSQLGAIFDRTDVDETCARMEDYGVPCEPCPLGRDDACVTIAADQLTATAHDLPLSAVDPADCD